MNKKFFFMLVSVVNFSALFADQSLSVAVSAPSDYDQPEIWTGVMTEGEENSEIDWMASTQSEFSIEIPDTPSKTTVVFLKRDFAPIILPITSEIIADGITLEFVEGMTVLGSVTRKEDSTPITNGFVSVIFGYNEHEFSVPLPSRLVWEISEDGIFEIRGVPLGEHTLTVVASGYMPATNSITVTKESQTLEIDFLLAKAEYIRGQIEYSRDGTHALGEIKVEVSPKESQTTEFSIEFDENKHFLIGPFAEDSEIELLASLPSGERSKPEHIEFPIERDVTLRVSHWVRIHGIVQDKDTGDPVPEFSLITNHLQTSFNINDPSGEFSVEVRDEVARLSIDSPEYAYWDSGLQSSLRGREELDLGTIKLERSYTVKGYVMDGATREPIEGAAIVKLNDENENMEVMRWNYLNVTASTNAEGEFELGGVRKNGGTVMASAEGYSSKYFSIEDNSVPIECELFPLGSISGQVVSREGKPITAQIQYAGGTFRAVDGNFHVNVGKGVHRYRAVADSGRSKVVEISVEAGQVVEDVRIVIEIVGRVYGDIVGLMEDETVRVWAIGTSTASDTITADGSYEFFGLEPGDYVIRSQTSFHRELEVPITLDESNEVRVDLEFPSGGSLTGRVFGSDLPLNEYFVIALPLDSSLPTGRTETDSDGSFNFKALANGIYQVTVPRRAFTLEVEVEGATTVELSVGDQSISGQIQAAGSVFNANVRLKGRPANRRLELDLHDVVDASGKFRFNGLPIGTYTIEVRHRDYGTHSQEIEVNDDIVDLNIYLKEVIAE